MAILRKRTNWQNGAGSSHTKSSTSFPKNSNGNGNGKIPPLPKIGRPTTYNRNWHPKYAYIFCSRSGYSNEQLAEIFDKPLKTIELWMRKYPEFQGAIRDGRWDFDSGRIQKSLATRACGYDIVERTYEYRTNEDTGEREKVVTREVTKHIPPDATSMIFWLCNRQKAYWRREVRHEHTGKVETQDSNLVVALKEMLKKAEPNVVTTLKETLENIVCANSEPL